MIFQQMKPGTNVIHHFHVILIWAIHFLYYFYDSRSSARSKNPFQGQLFNVTNKFMVR